MKLLSEYSFIRLLDFFSVLLVLFFPFFASVIFICYLFLFSGTLLEPRRDGLDATALLT
jgi:hypothetical protein